MFGFMKSKQKPADSPADAEDKNPISPRRTTSDPVLLSDSIEDDNGKGRKKRTPASTRASRARNHDKYKDDFRDSGGLQAQTMEDLEGYAVYKAEETTDSVNNCLRIAENIREDASKTLDTLHQQGEQIERTHQMAVGIDKDLSKGEKLLNDLGGVFSMPWKPKKTRDITGPVITADDNKKNKPGTKEQREKLGLDPVHKSKGGSKTTMSEPEPTDAIQKVELEKRKQDDALSDLSDILGDLKGMAVDMGSELDRQNKALDHLNDDVDELNNRVKGANARARKLLN
ncbi:putative SNAP25-like proteinous protein SNAP30 [Hibiscus syriacus]|uniref:SNAP25-like proteinous protein SNAP30 n=1 Tax=Hibiscus syriacus TaxID=106335 RepID=A0A6A3AZF6_HIBSY|nr:putative SNAP25 homologous protein SNAP30 [Hibiscus syriacus]KAE8710184.1 putative SNAP25-like proteinous protein SNAP30 [Hibiscus syriacus]